MGRGGTKLLDLRFLELDVLARHRVVLLQRQLLGHGPGVLLGDVEVAGVRRRVQADLDGGGLGHDLLGSSPARPEKRGADNTNRASKVNSASRLACASLLTA